MQAYGHLVGVDVLAARFVEANKLKWTTTLGEACPTLKGKIDGGWLDVTLEQWLTQTSGFPAKTEGSLRLVAMRVREGVPDLTFRDRRSTAIASALKEQPARKPGEKFEYANFNYLIAGHMLECVMNEDWEALMRRELFQPLGMMSAGFGPPPRLEGTQPDGERVRLDNPLTLGPAGTVHLTLDDWLRFCEVHLGEGPDDFLSQASREKLQTPAAGKYAMGWLVVQRPDGKVILTHDGSNTFWYARAILRSDAGRVMLVTLNKADRKACDEITDKLVSALFPPTTRPAK